MKLKKFRDPFSGLSHLAAALLSTFGLVFLLVAGWGNLQKEISLLVYGLSLIFLFSASAAYHLTVASDGVIGRLRKLDHSAIYVLIAGTYTPICLNFFHGFWRWGLLAIIWGMALGGIIVKLFIINAPRWVTAGIYLVMGWFCVMAAGEMAATMTAGAIFWLVMGGVVYSLGAVIYITKKLDFVPGVFGFHEVWHLFVILAALCHFILVAVYIAPV